jgi:pimeloyl-ACP methyl ester carboxylesterase
MSTLQHGEFITNPNGLDLWHRISGRGPLCLAPPPAGHFPWMEQPETFYEGIRRFLPGLGYR